MYFLGVCTYIQYYFTIRTSMACPFLYMHQIYIQIYIKSSFVSFVAIFYVYKYIAKAVYIQNRLFIPILYIHQCLMYKLFYNNFSFHPGEKMISFLVQNQISFKNGIFRFEAFFCLLACYTFFLCHHAMSSRSYMWISSRYEYAMIFRMAKQ